MLSLVPEEDAFWMLVGIVKTFNHIHIFDLNETIDEKDRPLNYYALTHRLFGFKNEMIILKIVVKLHLPEIYKKLKALGLPLEYYFYEHFTSMFAFSFSSDMVLRMWDMIILNLSTNKQENRKRALWYMYGCCLYMLK